MANLLPLFCGAAIIVAFAATVALADEFELPNKLVGTFTSSDNGTSVATAFSYGYMPSGNALVVEYIANFSSSTAVGFARFGLFSHGDSTMDLDLLTAYVTKTNESTFPCVQQDWANPNMTVMAGKRTNRSWEVLAEDVVIRNQTVLVARMIIAPLWADLSLNATIPMYFAVGSSSALNTTGPFCARAQDAANVASYQTKVSWPGEDIDQTGENCYNGVPNYNTGESCKSCFTGWLGESTGCLLNASLVTTEAPVTPVPPPPPVNTTAAAVNTTAAPGDMTTEAPMSTEVPGTLAPGAVRVWLVNIVFTSPNATTENEFRNTVAQAAGVDSVRVVVQSYQATSASSRQESTTQYTAFFYFTSAADKSSYILSQEFLGLAQDTAAPNAFTSRFTVVSVSAEVFDVTLAPSTASPQGGGGDDDSSNRSTVVIIVVVIIIVIIIIIVVVIVIVKMTAKKTSKETEDELQNKHRAETYNDAHPATRQDDPNGVV